MAICLNKKVLTVGLCLIIFALGSLIFYYPIAHKGYPTGLSIQQLIMARNLAAGAHFYTLADQKDVTLSADLAAKTGVPALLDHKLTTLIYAGIFKLFGFNPQMPVYLAIILFALTGSLLFLTVKKIFNLLIAGLFGVFYVFSPLMSGWATFAGGYEFALLFFALAVWFYFVKAKPTAATLILAGIFFALAGLSRNAFLFAFAPFFFYLIFKHKSWPKALLFLLPFLILVGTFFAVDYHLRSLSINIKGGDIGYNGHLFPDPYTYHFEKAEYLAGLKDPHNQDILSFLMLYQEPLSLRQKFEAYWLAAVFYPVNALRLVTFGGWLVFFLLLFGLVYIYKNKKDFLYFTLGWLVFWYLALIALLTSNEAHYVELVWPVFILAAAGLYFILEKSFGLIQSPKRQKFLAGLTVLFLIFFLVDANKWSFHEKYELTHFHQFAVMIDAIKKTQPAILPTDVIAVVSDDSAADLTLNYYTDCNCIYFAPATIAKLAANGRLAEIFNYFGVTKVIGLDRTMAEQVSRLAPAKVILVDGINEK